MRRLSWVTNGGLIGHTDDAGRVRIGGERSGRDVDRARRRPDGAVRVGRHPRRRPLVLPRRLEPGESFVSTVSVGGRRFDRTVVCTAWMTPGLDLAACLRNALGGRLERGDLIVVTEKVVVVTTGRGVPVTMVRPGRLARFVAAHVRPVGNSRGLSIPEKVQLVIDSVGRWRVAAAVAAGAATRPLGIHGAFYMVAGYVARSMDGMRPPYGDMLLPPLPPRVARAIAEQLTIELGHPVAIVDMNDRGGSVRSIAGAVMSRRLLEKVLADNPLGQRAQATPVAIVRPARRSSRSVTDRLPTAVGDAGAPGP